MKLLTICLSFFAILLSSFTLYQLNQTEDSRTQINKTKEFTYVLLERAKNSILINEAIKEKESIFNLIDSLGQQGTVIEEGPDDLRIKYVSLQGSIEHVLACAMVLGEIDHLVGVIHTPMPATPLCTRVDSLDEQLLDESIRYDLQKLLTIRSRAQIVRDYLNQGGKLYVAYPQGGFEKRSKEQQEVYKQTLAEYANQLVDTVLSCKEMDSSKIGATYFFKNDRNDLYVFSIKSSQADKPLESSEWGLWLGKIENKTIHERISEILDYLTANGAPNLMIELTPT